MGITRKTWRREGFWWSPQEDQLPDPVENVDPWPGQAKFLTALRERQSEAREQVYRGISLCRICRDVNGSSEYELDGWKWPSGFAHYVEAHNVRPSLAFQEFVLGHTL